MLHVKRVLQTGTISAASGVHGKILLNLPKTHNENTLFDHAPR